MLFRSTHTGGVSGPTEQFAAGVPDLAALLGATVACDNPRGEFLPSNGGYAVLGQLVADVTGIAYPDAVARLVLAPLGMRGSGFPTSWPDVDAITGYRLTDDGTFQSAPAQVSTMPAAGGMWTTAADLVRFGIGWAALLPGDLAAEAVRPQVPQPATGTAVGLGWLINTDKGVCGHSGAGPGAAMSLINGLATGTTTVVGTNRLMPIEPINARLARPIA